MSFKSGSSHKLAQMKANEDRLTPDEQRELKKLSKKARRAIKRSKNGRK